MTNSDDATSKHGSTDSAGSAHLDSLPDWVWETDVHGVFTYSNPAIRDILGYNPSEIVGRPGSEFLTEEDGVAFSPRQRGPDERPRGAKDLIAYFRSKDGSVKPVELCSSPLLDEEGRLVGFSGVGRDLTGRVTEARAAREVLANYRAVTDNSPTGIIILQSAKVVYANPRIMQLMGYTMADLPTLDIWSLIHPEDRERVAGYYRSRMAGEPTPEQHEVRAITRSGEVRHFELRATLIHFNGAPAVLDNVIDITDRRRAEEALKRSEEMYRGLVEEINDCVWEVDEEVRYTYISPKVTDILGYEPEEFLGHKPDDFMLPEDAEQMYAVMIPTVERVETIHPFPITMLHKNGGSVVLELNGKPIIDSHGHYRGYRGVARDITEQRRAQAALAQSEERFRKLVEEINDWVWEVDENAVYTYASPRIASLLGYEPEEVVGKTPFDLMLPDEVERIRGIFGPIAERREPLRALENTLVGKDGRIVVVETSGMPIFDSQGVYRGYRGIDRDVTDRVEAERELRERTAELEGVIDAFPDLYFWLDAERRIIDYHAVEKDLYVPPEQFMGRKMEDVMPADIGPRFAAAGDEAVRTLLPQTVIYTLPLEHGERVFEARLVAIPDHRFLVIARDVTDRIRFEERLTKLNDCFLSFGPDALANIGCLTALAGELLGATAALYNRLDEGTLYSWGQWHTPEDYKWVDSPEGHVCYDVIREGSEEPRVIRNLPQTTYAQTDPNVTSYGLQTYVGKAVRVNETSVGSLCCVYQRDYIPSQEDLKLLGIIASAIATEEMRREAELALRENERFLQNVFDGIQDGISVSDKDLNVLRVNRTMEKWYAYSMPLCGRKCYEVYHLGRKTPCEVCPSTRAMESKTLQMSLVPFRGPDGSTVGWFELYAFPLLDEDGEVWGVVEHVRDITDRKQAAAALAESESKYRNLVETTETGYLIVDTQGRVVDANAEYVRQTGHGTLDQIRGRSVVEWTAEYDLERNAEEVRKCAETGRVRNLVIDYVWLDGTIVPIEIDATVIETAEGPRILTLCRDITERRRTEEEIQRLSRQNELILDSAGEGIFGLDMHGMMTFINPSAARMVGYEVEELVGKHSHTVWHHARADGTPYPQEECRIYAALRDGLSHQVDDEVFWRKDGSSFPVNYVSTPITERGRVVGAVVVFADVTERKRAEEALRESEERYRLLFERSPDVVFMMRGETFLEVNSAVERILGYRPEELVGTTLWDMSPEFQPDGQPSREKAMGHIRRALEAGPHSFEWVHCKKDGTPLECEVSLASCMMRGEMHILAIVRDVSERKRAEEQRVALERQLEAQKRQFYRDTILSVTDGKLDICEPAKVNKYKAGAQLTITVDSPAGVSEARHRVERLCSERGLSPERLETFMIGVGEAITNAIKHAQKGHVYAGQIDDSLWVGVEDRGLGISSLILPKATLLRGYSTKPSLGLGYTIMLGVSDQILLMTGEQGTTVILIKRFQEPVFEVGAAQLPDTWDSVPT